ncbi:MAG: tape measure protein [Bacteroidetes bacterium]|nr:tape measure protein [Bacteroidota bacterium]
MAGNVVEIKILVDGKEGRAEIQLTDEQLKKLGGSAKKAGEDGDEGLQKMVNPLTEINQGLELAKKVFSIFSQPIQTAADLEQAKTSFEVMLGSVEAADQAIQTLKQKANSTPFEFTDLQSATQLLLNFGITIEDAYPIIDQLGDISGGNAQKLQQLALVMGQVSSAGKLQGQDLLQLINAGFNPLQEISRTTGQSMADLKKQMESGAISYDMVKASMVSATSEGGRFFGMMEKQSQTLAGQMSTVSDAIGQISATIGQSMMPVVSGFVTVAGDVTSGLNAMNPALVGVLGTVGLLTAAFVTMRVTGLSAMITEGNAWIMTTGRMAIANAATAVSTGGLTAAIRLATSAVTGFFASLGPIGWAVIGITAIATVWGILRSNTDEATEAVKRHVSEVKTLRAEKLQSELNDVNASLSVNRAAILSGKGNELDLQREQNKILAEKEKIILRIKLAHLAVKDEVIVEAEAEKKSTEEKFNYFKALSLETQKEKEVNQAILDGDNARLKVAKEELTVLQDKIKAYQALNGLKSKPTVQTSSPDLPSTISTPQVDDLAASGISTKSSQNVDYRSDDQRFAKNIALAKSQADAQISFEQLTTDQKIKQTEDRLRIAKSGSDEEKQLASDLTNFHLTKYYEELASREQTIQEMQGLWMNFSQDILDTSVTGKERMNRIWQGMKLEFIQETGKMVIAHVLGEKTKTAAATEGAIARVAITSWEVAIIIAKKMAAMVASIWTWYITSFGPLLGPVLAAASSVAIVALAKASIKAVGFAEGGIVDRPTYALIGEGEQREVISPEQTYVDVAKNILIPRVISEIDFSQINRQISPILEAQQMHSYIQQAPVIDYDRFSEVMGRVTLKPVIDVDARKLADANDLGIAKRDVLRS